MITTISNSTIKANINTIGAELISLQNQNNKEFIWESNPEYWGKHSPVLFPIVGTLKNNSYTFDSKTYHLSRHGFARDSEFEIIKKNKTQVVLSLQSAESTRKLYPFEFELQISYTVFKNELIIGYKIINNDDIKMPFSIGGHPAFALSKKFESYSLAFEYPENLLSYQLENDLLSDKTCIIPMENNKLPLTYSLFENDALIFKKLLSKRISILEDNIPILHLKFDDFPNFGIWTKKNAPFICLEPWLGYSDTSNCSGSIIEKEGIQFVGSKKTFECQFSIEIV